VSHFPAKGAAGIADSGQAFSAAAMAATFDCAAGQALNDLCGSFYNMAIMRVSLDNS